MNGLLKRSPSSKKKKSAWHVYILLCRNHYLYTGITTDLKRRFQEHRGGSARFTAANPPVKMVYHEPCVDRSQALKREAAIKRLSRPRKMELIRSR